MAVSAQQTRQHTRNSAVTAFIVSCISPDVFTQTLPHQLNQQI